jgi:hypothetical protein
MSTQEPRSAPGTAGRFAFKSINQKVIASVALLLIIGLGGLVAYQSYTSRVLALNTFDDSNAILTRTLADNMVSSVKYAREEALINSYKEISQNPRAGLDGIMVYLADGKVLNSFAQPDFEIGLLKGFVDSNKLGEDKNIIIGASENELRVSASRSRCRNLVGLNAGMFELPRGPMEFPVGGLGVGAWIADRSEWASPWGEVDHRTRTGCFETGRDCSGCRTGIGAARRQAPAVA